MSSNGKISKYSFVPAEYEVFSKLGYFLFHCKANSDGTVNVTDLALKLAFSHYKKEDLRFLVKLQDSKPIDDGICSAEELIFYAEKSLIKKGSLSKRQAEVVGMLANNCTNKEISNALNITVRTVKYHISALFAMFNCKERHELASKYLRFKEALQ